MGAPVYEPQLLPSLLPTPSPGVSSGPVLPAQLTSAVSVMWTRGELLTSLLVTLGPRALQADNGKDNGEMRG